MAAAGWLSPAPLPLSAAGRRGQSPEPFAPPGLPDAASSPVSLDPWAVAPRRGARRPPHHFPGGAGGLRAAGVRRHCAALRPDEHGDQRGSTPPLEAAHGGGPRPAARRAGARFVLRHRRPRPDDGGGGRAKRLPRGGGLRGGRELRAPMIAEPAQQPAPSPRDRAPRSSRPAFLIAHAMSLPFAPASFDAVAVA